MQASLEKNTLPQSPLSKKRRFLFFANRFAGLASMLIAVLVLIFSLYLDASITKQVDEAKVQLAKQQSQIASDLDAKIERLENLTLQLQKEGFVKADEFADLAGRIHAATVLVTSSKESITLSPSGEITTTKEFDPEGSSGSGFFIRSDGLVATAKHVVEAIGQDNLTVITQDGKKHTAALVAFDERADIAVVKIASSNHAVAELGHFENLKAGDEIGFVGYALGAGISRALVHRGVVSTKGNDQNGAALFTINSFINRGNSGGPVFSAKTGRVIGVIAARQKAKTSEKIMKLPPGYAPAVSFGGTDPVRLSVELYNKTLEIVGDVSQVGIGIAYSADVLSALVAE